MNLKRILPYLLLNVLVSAVTTFAILWWWQQKHPVQPTIVVLPTADAATAVTPEALKPTSAVTAAAVEVPEKGKKVVEIQNVFGAEDLKTEVVRIKYLGGNELPLTGWTLSGGSGGDYTFPELTLYKDGAIDVFTRAGPDTSIELHRGLDQAVLASGVTLKLVDPQGNVQARYQVP